MNKYIAILLLAFSGSVYADSYLCIADAYIGVANDGNGNINAITYDALSQKWIFSNEDGKQEVKAFGSNEPYYGPCGRGGGSMLGAYKCVMDYSDQMFFVFRLDKTYIATIIGIDDSYNVQMGRCSKI